MFNTLLESKAKGQRLAGGTAFSIFFHTVVGVLAIVATLHAGITNKKEKVEKLDFVEVKKAPEPPKPPPKDVFAPPPPKGFQVLTAPINIPDVIPDVDLTKHATDEADFTGKGAAGGTAKGTGDKPTDQPYFDFQVEKQAAAVPGSPTPHYPEMLTSAGIEGQVFVEFVIDTTGRADMNTFKVLKSDHELFSQEVKMALPKMRFYPAEVGGRKVKELVQLPFAFALTKK
jgi:periplasmic protein TonB